MAQTHKSAKLKECPTKYVLIDRQWLSSLIAEVNKLHEDNFVALNSNQWSICEHKKQKRNTLGFRLKQTKDLSTMSFLSQITVYHYLDLILIAWHLKLALKQILWFCWVFFFPVSTGQWSGTSRKRKKRFEIWQQKGVTNLTEPVVTF